MMARQALIAPHVQAFFAEHLCQHKRVSSQTIASYRDTFRLLLTFVKATTGIEPSALHIQDLDAPVILRFLDYLERQRGNAIRSRNVRLAAIRSFARFLALRDPESLAITTRVLAIPSKRTDKKLIGYLTRPEVEALLAAPDRSSWGGRRDYALLLTLYNSGARVSEMTTLQRKQVCFGPLTFLQLTGKGRKERTVPLWPQTRQVLQAWFEELGDHADPMAFPSARGRPLSREGVDYLLQKAIQKAARVCPSLSMKRITPHVMRHYLPFLTMSSHAKHCTDMPGNSRSRRPSLLLCTRHSFPRLETVKKIQQRITRLIATQLPLRWCCFGECLLFHRQRCFEINLGGFDGFMPEPQGNH